MIFKVHKRTGEIVNFAPKKIFKAIFASAKDVEITDENISIDLTQKVIDQLNHLSANTVPSVEDIQDTVENVLIESGHPAMAKAYILYREKRRESRSDKAVMVHVDKTITEYLEKIDWRVNANSNQGYSLGGMILNTSGKVTANYWLSHIYPKNVGEAHRNGEYHIHDLDMFSGYCAGWSLRALLEEGFNGVPNSSI